MDKNKALNIVDQMRLAMKATPQEHELIVAAINYLSTLTEPEKAQDAGNR